MSTSAGTDGGMNPMRIGHYDLKERLGAGGMGEVYRAEDTRLARTVAIKILPQAFAPQREALERFRREARTASGLNHPHICTIHDIDEHDGVPFIVMEYLDGAPLSEMLRGGRLETSRAVELASELLDALDAAHAHGIVHRDIKPANIFVTRRGQAKLLDFGLAKSAGPLSKGDATISAADPLTSPGTALGTVAYMSPEQARGEALDARTDLFSFGAVFYEMLTGRRAFPGASAAVVFAAILGPSPIHPSDRADLPADLVRILDKALEKDRRLRCQSAADLRADLLRVQRAHSAPTAADSSPAVRAIAVLPFKDLQPQSGHEFWGVGVADAIIGRLATLHHLAVRPTSAVLKFVTGAADVREIARELQVDSVLDGTFLRAADLIRVSVQLVGAHGAITWAGRYDLRADDALRFQDEVAQRVLEGLSVPLSPSERRALASPVTRSNEAYDLYLRA